MIGAWGEAGEFGDYAGRGGGRMKARRERMKQIGQKKQSGQDKGGKGKQCDCEKLKKENKRLKRELKQAAPAKGKRKQDEDEDTDSDDSEDKSGWGGVNIEGFDSVPLGFVGTGYMPSSKPYAITSGPGGLTMWGSVLQLDPAPIVPEALLVPMTMTPADAEAARAVAAVKAADTAALAGWGAVASYGDLGDYSGPIKKLEKKRAKARAIIKILRGPMGHRLSKHQRKKLVNELRRIAKDIARLSPRAARRSARKGGDEELDMDLSVPEGGDEMMADDGMEADFEEGGEESFEGISEFFDMGDMSMTKKVALGVGALLVLGFVGKKLKRKR